MQVKKPQLELDIKQQTGSRSGKESMKAVYCHPAYLIYMQSISWKWQPTPVFLPGEFHGQRSLAGYRPWGCKESGMTEHLSLTHILRNASLDEAQDGINIAGRNINNLRYADDTILMAESKK